MPITSPYFNHYHAINEQNLIEGMVIESIFIKGIPIAYIPRTQDNINYLYNEDPTNVFTSHKSIAMYPAFVDGFDGDEMFSQFGVSIKKSGTFIVSKKQFAELFPEFIRPREGDLLFMPVTNAILEIKFVDAESPFFEKGKQYVWELRTETFEYGYEEMETGNQEIDDILSHIIIDDPENETEAYGKNDEIQDDVEDDIVFDPNNPFGIR